MKPQLMPINSTLVSLAIVKKFQERKKFLETMPARFLTEQEFREYQRIQELEKRFLN